MIFCDRFEGEYAVMTENDRTFNVKKEFVREDVKEGMAVILKDGIYIPDNDATKTQREKNNALLQKLLSK